MPNDVYITYVNKSMNKDLPKIFLFTTSELPTFNSLIHGVAWRVIENIGQGSMSKFVVPAETSICATWNNSSNFTKELSCDIGQRYSVVQNETGIVLVNSGKSLNPLDIELTNEIQTPNGVSAELSKSGSVIVRKEIVAFRQKASFRLRPKIYWGIASEIGTSESISSAVLDSEFFF